MSLTSDQRKQLKIVTPEFRGSFVNLVKPRKQIKSDDGREKEPRYEITVVLPKEHPFWEGLREKIVQCAKFQWGDNLKGLVLPVHDGDAKGYEGMVGCNYVSTSNTYKPQIIDPDGNEMLPDAAELYSGAWYRITLTPYPWEHTPTRRRGISMGLGNVMKVRDDVAFGGRRRASEDFAEFIGTGSNADENPLG